MSIPVNIGASSYNVGTNGQRGWGTDLTNLLIRLSAVANQVVTANYTLTNDIFFSDVSGTYALKANFLKGVGAIASADGFIRMASPHANPGQGLSYPGGTPEGKSYTYISWRNSTNSGDLHLFPNSDNQTVQFNGRDFLNATSVQNIANKTIDVSNVIDGGAISAGTITGSQISAIAAIAYSKLAALTASRLLVSDGSGVVSVSAATATEAGYLSGVTSAIQTQLNAKIGGNAPITPGTATKVTYDAQGLITAGTNITAADLPSAIDAAKIGDGSVSTTEFQYINSVTSNVQTQINNKLTTNPQLENFSTTIQTLTSGFIAENGVGLFNSRTMTAASSKIVITNGSGVSANPTFDVVEANLSHANIGGQLAATQIAAGTVSNTVFGYLAGVTSAIQTQLDAKEPTITVLGVTRGGTGVTTSTGSGNNVLSTSPTLVTPALGTPSAAVLTNATGLPLTTGVTGTLAITNGGTGQTTANTAFNALSPMTTKGDLIAYGTTAARLAVGTDGQVLVADSGQTLGVKWAAATAGSGSGEKNYIGNPNNATNWTASGAGITVTTESTVGNIPDNSTQTTGIKFLRVSGADYAYYRFTLDSVDYNKKLKVVKDIKYAGTAGDYTVRVFSNTASNYSGTSAELTVSPSTSIPTGTGQVQMSFDSSGSTAPYLEVRIYGVAGTTAIYMNNFLVGPGVLGSQIGAGPVPITVAYYDNGVTLLSPTTVVTKGRRLDNVLKLHFYVLQSNNANANPFILQLPSGYTIDTSEGATSGSNTGYLGNALYFDGTNRIGAEAFRMGATTNQIQFVSAAGATVTSAVLNNASRWIEGELSIPIAEWAGSGTLNSGAGAQVEYAYNSSTSTATDTTSFASGSQGALIQSFAPAGTASVSKRIQFQTPIQNNDLLVLEIDDGTGVFQPFNQRFGSLSTNDAGTTYYGQALVQISSTQMDVAFYSQAIPGLAWSGLTTRRWRVRKVNASSPVGFGLATATASGLVSYEDSGSFTVYLKSGSAVGNTGPTGASGLAYYTRVGKSVTIQLPALAASLADTTLTLSTSNASSTNTWPAALTPVTVAAQDLLNTQLTSVGAPGIWGLSTTGVLSVMRDASGNNFGGTTTTKGIFSSCLRYVVI